jgi:prepilin-type N-terminal cleavage/methylation domain-containing protein
MVFHRNDQRGFTVVELMISMALIAILASLSFFAVQTIMPGYRLNGAIRMVRGDLYNAKMLAAKKNRQYKVVFTTNGYQVQRGTSNTGAFSLDQVELSRTFSDYPRVTVKTSATADPVFSPRGTATNGTITLQNSGGDEKTITTSIAGRIKIN